jgi:hypothetical protein
MDIVIEGVIRNCGGNGGDTESRSIKFKVNVKEKIEVA